MLTDAERRVVLAADPRNSRVFRPGQPEAHKVAVVEIPLAIDSETWKAAKQRAVVGSKPR